MSDEIHRLATRALVEHDAAAWEQLFRLMNRRLYGLASTLGVPVDRREDLLQSVWKNLLGRLQNSPWDPAIDLPSYLFAILRNLWRRQVQSNGHGPTLSLEEAMALSREDDPAVKMEKQELLEQVEQAAGDLDETERKIFLLRRDGLSFQEIAQRFQLGEAAVRGKYHRIVRKVLARVQDEEQDGGEGGKKKKGANLVESEADARSISETSHEQR